MSEGLTAIIAGEVAGRLVQGRGGALSFVYEPSYAGPPLSLVMPIANRTYGDATVRPYLFGLLPDSAEVRGAVGREYGVSGNNPFALLAHIGRDCPGAVQICPEDEVEATLASEGRLESVPDEQIAQRLALARQDEGAGWETQHEHWSIGGQQSKFALRLKEGKWYSCHGASATTHIIKPGIGGLNYEALNEFLCLRAAAGCGIAASHVEYRLFEAEPAIVVARYDRLETPDGVVHRLHQEDLCQALGVLPENKYTENGGPSAPDIITLLKRSGGHADRNVRTFVEMLFFNYLIGAPDAHAKNYSVLLDRSDAILAPLYDVASMVPYAQRVWDIKLAMGIAGENRVGMLSSRRLARFARQCGTDECGLTCLEMEGMLASLCQRVPRAFEHVVGESASIPGVDELAERLLPGIKTLCELSEDRLG